jgi:hypothetical protein
MKKFIIVVHSWFIDSKYFQVEEIQSESKLEAEKEAAYITKQMETTFRKCAYKVIEIHKNEHIKINTRKLTWKERVTGKITNTSTAGN